MSGVLRRRLLARTAGLVATGLCPSVRAAQKRAIDAIGARLEPAQKLVCKEVDGRKLHLHVFEAEGAAPAVGRPAFLIIHGGGWTGGAPRQFYPMADYFARKGMLAACLEYRLMRTGTGVTPATCVRDARSAMRYLKSHAGELAIHPARIAAGGGSAGGHLAAGTALFTGMDESGELRDLDPTPAALVLWYPVIDTSEQGYGQAKCGAEWRSLSPLHQVRAGLPPTRLFHGTGDTVTPYTGAEAFDRAMRTAGNECELIRLPGVFTATFFMICNCSKTRWPGPPGSCSRGVSSPDVCTCRGREPVRILGSLPARWKHAPAPLDDAILMSTPRSAR